jgi:hypothetical protein
MQFSGANTFCRSVLAFSPTFSFLVTMAKGPKTDKKATTKAAPSKVATPAVQQKAGKIQAKVPKSAKEIIANGLNGTKKVSTSLLYLLLD